MVANSLDVPAGPSFADSYREPRGLAEDRVRFALNREDSTIEHHVPTGVVVAA